MKILVTGGAGYIGGKVTDILLERGYEVIVYGSLLYEEAYRKEHKNLNFVYGDIRERDKLKKEMDKSDCIIHLCALVGDGACALNPDLTYEINTKSVEWITSNYDKKIIFTSTCSVYGVQLKEGLLNENSNLNPQSEYASSKLQSEEILKQYNNSLILRLGTVFGIGDLFSRIRMDLVVNIMVAKASMNKKLLVFGGEQYRPLIHVSDVAEVIANNVDSSNTGIFNISKENIKILDLAYKIKNIIPCEIQLQEMNFQDSRNYKVSNEKMTKILNFNPNLTIEYGVDQLLYLINSRRIKDINNCRYNNALFLKNNQ